MADSVNTNTLFSGTRRKIYQFTNVSDGTGESAVVKVDISTLTGPNKSAPPSKLVVEAIDYNIQGFTSVTLYFDATTDDEIAVLPAGSGVVDFTYGGGLVDPQSSGATGDIVLTTTGAAANASYDITLYVRLKE